MKHLISLFLILLLIACGGNKKDEFAQKSAMELMEEIEQDEYTPPSDGKLTDGQVQMYIKVKHEELSYAKEAAEKLKQKAEQLDQKEKEGKKPGLKDYMTAYKALGDVANFVTADLRAAKSLGYNAKEYEWVRNIIIETDVSIWQDTTLAAASTEYSKMLEHLKQQRSMATTEQERNLYDQQIAAFSESIKEMEESKSEPDAAAVYNKQLLMKYKDQILGLQAEIKKWHLLQDDDKLDNQ